jgi:hypothetical protein
MSRTPAEVLTDLEHMGRGCICDHGFNFTGPGAANALRQRAKVKAQVDLAHAAVDVARALQAFERWAHHAALDPGAHPERRQGIADALGELRRLLAAAVPEPPVPPPMMTPPAPPRAA